MTDPVSTAPAWTAAGRRTCCGSPCRSGSAVVTGGTLTHYGEIMAALTLTDRLLIRWHHRRVGHPDVHRLRVRFDEIITANSWNLAPTFDDLFDRYGHLY